MQVNQWKLVCRERLLPQANRFEFNLDQSLVRRRGATECGNRITWIVLNRVGSYTMAVTGLQAQAFRSLRSLLLPSLAG